MCQKPLIERLFSRGMIFLFALALSVCLPVAVSGEEDSSKSQQAAFTERYDAARQAGPEAYRDFVENVMNQGTLEEVRMMDNLDQGKTADGQGEREAPRGFMGDPNDPGPVDWSDWIIETDADGNVTGFQEKDFDEKDADGDGEISDEERKQWDEKKKKEHEEAGGAPGEVPPVADWDKDGDGQPDPDFVRDCWQCRVPPPGELNECVDGAPGPCDGHACSDQEQCQPHTETHGGREYECHTCVPDSVPPGWCEERGFSPEPSCGGECPPPLCVSIDVDIASGKILTPSMTRERGSTHPCFTCMTNVTVEVTYVILIIETPRGRFVLDRDDGDRFEASSIMALAKVDPETGKILNTLGQLRDIRDFAGAFTAGAGVIGPVSGGKLGIDQLAGLLRDELDRGGSYSQNCFEDAASAADEQAESSGMPTAADIEGSGKNRDRAKEVFSVEELKRAEEAGDPAVTGPILVCGQQDRDRVLRVFDAAGSLVDAVTRDMLKDAPDVIREKLGIAQQLSDVFTGKGREHAARYIEKFTGLPLTGIEEQASRLQALKARAEELAEAVKDTRSRRKKDKPKELVFPDDPLYQQDPSKKKRSSRRRSSNPLGSAMRMGASALREKKASGPDVKDQWGLQEIGFTPWDDPDSAWNVVDASRKNVVVAVLDSGLDLQHPDGPQFLWSNPREIPGNGIDDDGNGFVDDIHGWNFVDEKHDFTDVHGHGTFVAGIIAARFNNGTGIAGINPGAVIMPVKVVDEEGETDSFRIYQGIQYAVSHGARVLNVSLGARGISKLEQAAINRANAMGTLVVVAAGNSNEDVTTFGPASARHALSVGQIDIDGTRSTVSNWGPNLGLVGPGEQIYSLCSKDNKHALPSVREEGYFKQDGTSFAAPMVAATASLILARDPELSPAEVRDRIVSTASPLHDDDGWDGMTGAGLLDAAAALRVRDDDPSVFMLTNLRVNTNARGKVVSVDVYATIRGDFQEYYVEVSKGSRGRKFRAVAGPLTEETEAGLITRIDTREHMRGSRDWIVRVRAVGEDGNERLASTLFRFP